MQTTINQNKAKAKEIQEGFNSLAILISESDNIFEGIMEKSPSFYNALTKELYIKNGEIGTELVHLNNKVKTLLNDLIIIINASTTVLQ